MKRKDLFLVSSALLAGLAALFLLIKKRQPVQNNPTAAPNQGLYHFLSPLYDLLFGRTYAKARQRTVCLLGLQPGERLLISGVGTGLDLPLIPAGTEVVGVDIAVEMLRLAGRKPSPATVKLIQMDAQCLELPSESFDAALLNLIVSVAPDGRAVFQEAWRALKPGGRLVLFDKFLPEGQSVSFPRNALGAIIRWIGTDINRQLSQVLGKIENGRIEINEPSLFFGQYRILKIIKEGPIPEEGFSSLIASQSDHRSL